MALKVILRLVFPHSMFLVHHNKSRLDSFSVCRKQGLDIPVHYIYYTFGLTLLEDGLNVSDSMHRYADFEPAGPSFILLKYLWLCYIGNGKEFSKARLMDVKSSDVTPSDVIP